MADELSFKLRSGTDSQAVVEFASACPGTSIEHSAVYGPKCAYARTLPVQYEGGAELLVPEPCYWTPALPFLYDVSVRRLDADGRRQETHSTIGLRRLAPWRGSLYWGGKRVVLRGTRVDRLRPELVAGARAAELTLIIPSPSEEQCDLADLHGVPLVADLMALDLDVEELIRLAKHPSVVLLLIDGHQDYPGDLPRLPTGALLAVARHSDGAPHPHTWCDAIAVELNSGERPSASLASAEKPVIAIAAERAYADFAVARVACDHLQASLAPEFDLAGYFVSGARETSAGAL